MVPNDQNEGAKLTVRLEVSYRQHLSEADFRGGGYERPGLVACCRWILPNQTAAFRLSTLGTRHSAGGPKAAANLASFCFLAIGR